MTGDKQCASLPTRDVNSSLALKEEANKILLYCYIYTCVYSIVTAHFEEVWGCTPCSGKQVCHIAKPISHLVNYTLISSVMTLKVLSRISCYRALKSHNIIIIAFANIS